MDVIMVICVDYLRGAIVWTVPQVRRDQQHQSHVAQNRRGESQEEKLWLCELHETRGRRRCQGKLTILLLSCEYALLFDIS